MIKTLKKILLLTACIAFVVTCTSKKDDTLLSGKIQKPTNDKLILYSNDREQSQEITVNTEGIFTDTIHNMEGYCSIEYGKNGADIYIEKGYDMQLTINPENPQKLLTFQGESKAANQLISQIEKEMDEALEKIGLQKLFTLPEQAFIATIDSITKANISTIDKANISKKLAESEKKKIAYSKYYILSVYPNNYSIFTDKNYTPSQKFKEAQGQLSYDSNEEYKQFSMYRSLVKKHYNDRLYKAQTPQERKEIIVEIKKSPIKKLAADFAYKLMPSLSNTTERIEENIANVKYLSSDKAVLKKLEENVAYIRALGKGTKSPQFNFKDINGKKVSLNDLKGKLVYIDVWATWCGPCKDELPALQKIEKAYQKKKIAFVSISVDEDPKAWKKMVKEKNLSGIQLIADRNWKSSFVESYRIQGIPRFILIDSEGKIISANAPRPSNPDLLFLIEESLAKI